MNKKIIIIVGILIFCVLVILGYFAFSGNRAGSIYKNALSLESENKPDEALKLYQKITTDYPKSGFAVEAWYRLGNISQIKGMPLEAREIYKKIINNFPDSKLISKIQEELWNLNIEILFSSILTPTDKYYAVQPGDSLDKISKNFNSTIELIKKSNKLTSEFIKPGMKLKVPTVKYNILVDKSQNILMLKSNDEIIKTYSVATGENNCTPVGTFKIINKLVDPVWYKAGTTVPPNSPENILGSRWMGISATGYGIHGGAGAEVMGKQKTRGCVRMSNVDVEELFTIVPVGTEVTVVD